MPEVIRKKYWNVGVHTYGYEIGKARTLFYVKFLYPAAFYGKKEGNVLKLYKTLAMAEKKALNFEKKNPAESLEEVRRKLAEMKRKT